MLEACPNCGAEYKAGRLACPECGSDAETGWKSSEEIDYMSVDLPDDDSGVERSSLSSPRMLYIAALLAFLAMLVFLFLR
ncbi:MAG: hypothetical protein ACYTG5_00570 [Planctomycetota bacterium]